MVLKLLLCLELWMMCLVYGAFKRLIVFAVDAKPIRRYLRSVRHNLTPLMNRGCKFLENSVHNVGVAEATYVCCP